MRSTRFSRYVLRTTDVDAAGRFYDAVLGHRGDEVEALQEAALARGARPHWLGVIDARGAGGAAAVAAELVARGAAQLGPASERIVLRDAGGAIFAVSDGPGVSAARVVWNQLSTRDAESAAERHATLLGWSLASPLDWGPLGRHRPFAYGAGEPHAGAISGVEDRPGVHTHWLFFFSVPSLAAALTRVREHGGAAVGPLRLPSGVWVAACDDSQGAAFGLVEASDVARLVGPPAQRS